MNLGLPELLVIAVFAFIIVGPDKLPKAGEAIGKFIRRFREAADKVRAEASDKGIDVNVGPRGVSVRSDNPFLALSAVGHALEERFGQDAGEGEGEGDGEVSHTAAVRAPHTAAVRLVRTEDAPGQARRLRCETERRDKTCACDAPSTAAVGLVPTEHINTPEQPAANDSQCKAETPGEPTHRVIRLSDKETFTQRRLRIQEQAGVRAEASRPSGGAQAPQPSESERNEQEEGESA